MVKVKDLNDRTGSSFNKTILVCFPCGSEYSANKGDYFALSPDHVLTCCDKPMELVTKTVRYQKVNS